MIEVFLNPALRVAMPNIKAAIADKSKENKATAAGPEKGLTILITLKRPTAKMPDTSRYRAILSSERFRDPGGTKIKLIVHFARTIRLTLTLIERCHSVTFRILTKNGTGYQYGDKI